MTKREFIVKVVLMIIRFENFCFFKTMKKKKKEVIYRFAKPVIGCNRATDDDELPTDNIDPS
jgi:hypothetical protein